MSIFQMLLAAIAPVVSLALLLIVWKVRFGKHPAVLAARKSAKSFRRTVTGDLEPVHDGRRDFRIAAGLAVQKSNKKKKWVSQGKISDETIHSIAP
ncbi:MULTISPECIES: hypothetical protein [unclassified Labrenzia]|uniref:hypothetical protein n=1 Tax=unclassified Labrenzia TaxID=2648686 RepID=UPI001268B736|nr:MULTISPECIES: hypothetical protein [unclassified Labrenzia]